MKILMAAPYKVRGRYKGGISTIVNRVIEESELLKENNLEIFCFETCRIDRGVQSGKFNLENIRNFFCIYKSLPKEVKRTDAELIYYHTSVGFALLKDLIAIRHAKRQTKRKVVLHIHFADYKKILTGIRIVDKYILNTLKNYIDHIIFLSKETRKEFIKCGIEEEKCSVIYNFSTLCISDVDLQHKWQTRDNKLKLLFIGSLDERKGILDLLKCLQSIQGNYILKICGLPSDEKIKAELKKYHDKLGDQVVFCGYIDGEEKKNIFLESDVLILPSYGEGLPLVILEAYHAGCTVISTNVGAIPEILKPENGYIIEPGDLEQLEKTIIHLLASKKKVRIKQKHNAEIVKEYTIRHFIEEVASVCEKTINQNCKRST